LVCSAQSPAIPFKQIERNAGQSVNLQVLSGEDAINDPIEAYPASRVSSSFVYSRPTYNKPRILDSKFFLLNGLHLGLAALDIGLTQRCIAAHHCREGNPLMPSSLAGQMGVDSALFGSSVFISYQLKKLDSKLWWFSPAMGIGGHAAGAVTGFIHR
jgi:hypothetical protein